MEDVTEDNQRNVKELMGMKQNGNTLVDYVARVDQSPSISGNEKRPCNESLSQRDLRNLLKRKRYLSDSPLNYYRYLLLKMDEALCDKDQTRLRSPIFPTHFMTYLEKGSQSEMQQYSSRVPGECLSFEDFNYLLVHQIISLTIELACHIILLPPGGNLFGLNKLMILINITNTHWILACVFLEEKRVQIYDSLPSETDDRQYWLDLIKKYLSEEYR